MRESTFNTPEILSAENIPALPQTLVKLMECCNDPEVEIGQLGPIVSQDLVISTKVINLANSAFLGTRTNFTSIDQAVIYLGMDTLKNIVVSVSVHETFKDRKQHAGLRIEEFWYHSLLTAILAKDIAELIGHHDPGAAYLAGLLHDVGKFILAESYGDKYCDLLTSLEPTDNLHHKEKSEFGISHAEASASFAIHWRLSDSIGLAAGTHHNRVHFDKETPPLAILINLANSLTKGLPQDPAINSAFCSALKVTENDLETILLNGRDKVSDIAQSLQIPIQEPNFTEPISKQPFDSLLNNNVKSLSHLYGILDNFTKAKNTNRVFLVLEESLQIHFNIEQSVIFLPDSTDRNLTPYGSFRNQLFRKLRSVTIPLLPSPSNIAKSVYLQQATTLSTNQNNLHKDDAFILDEFGVNCLHLIPFAISDVKRGVMVFSLPANSDNLGETNEPQLLLLGSHLGNRLHLDQIKSEYAENLAAAEVSALEQVARVLSHEISNPLGIIQNYLAILAGKKKNSVNGELEHIGIEIERINKITKQLNSLSTVPPQGQKQLTDVRDLIVSSVQLFKNSLSTKKEISFEIQCPEPLPRIMTQPDSLRQILFNLITNSIEAIGTQGKILIQCNEIPVTEKNQKNELLISVIDNGPGFPAELLTKLFKAGYTSKGTEHSGLGLAIVQKFTADLTGRVNHSTTQTGETQFNLYLPL